GRQSRDVDVVLDRDRNAEKREIAVAFGGERLGFGERVGLVAQCDEDRGIIVRADARVGARDRGLGARRAPAMRRHDCGYRLAQHVLRPLLSRAILASTLLLSSPRKRGPMTTSAGI